MSWFRTRARWGSWLALFALALQLTLSFAHVHLGDARDPGLATVLADAQPSPAGDPAGHDHPAAADDHCPICALIHLARALVPAEAPALALPGVFERVRFQAAREFHLAAPDAALFRARAPPIA
ncbi:MAG TPA: DUF2946 family protein [Xanthobacteraceae bacterium]|nr:DUF2946 family protein [Xanthobacteraceae bacterium]